MFHNAGAKLARKLFSFTLILQVMYFKRSFKKIKNVLMSCFKSYASFFRYHYPRMPRIFYVSLKVGQREFIGQGPTRQAARHSAAAKALKVFVFHMFVILIENTNY